MSSSEELAAELSAAVHGLREIRELVGGGGRDAFVDSVDRQRALALCWVSVGSALKHYSQMTESEHGQPPLAAPIRFRDRLAHQRLDRLDPEILWETSVRQTPVLLRIVEGMLEQLGPR